MSPTYPEQRFLESIMQLREIEVGKPLTEIQYKAISFLCCGGLEKAKEMKVQKLMDIRFNQDGVPFEVVK